MLSIKLIGTDSSGAFVHWNGVCISTVKRFPALLSHKLVEVLSKTIEHGAQAIEYDGKTISIQRNPKKNTKDINKPSGDELNSIVKDTLDLSETIKLLYWFLSPHIIANDPNLLNGIFHCIDCEREQEKNKRSQDICIFETCPSHEKLARIFINYSVPEKSLAEQAFCGLPKAFT